MSLGFCRVFPFIFVDAAGICERKDGVIRGFPSG